MIEHEKIVALTQKINQLSETGEDFYLIPRSELCELIRSNEILCALVQGGVDNWEWHGDSLYKYISNFCDGLGITDEEDKALYHTMNIHVVSDNAFGNKVH